MNRPAHTLCLGRVARAAILLLPLLLQGCRANTPAVGTPTPVTVHVGYFPNITHSQALIGVARGDFAKALGSGYQIEPLLFNAGPSVIEALFAGQIDLAYIGPNPAVNGFVRSEGQALRVIAGATSGGAGLVSRAGSALISADGLSGKRIATPQLGNTQDIALRAYLLDHGLQSAEKGGTVEVVPVENPQILDLFRLGQLDGAWVPEPWASRLIVEGGGTMLLDERELWPDGKFATAIVIVSTAFLQAHPDAVASWLAAHIEITLWEADHPAEALTLVNGEIARLTGKALPQAVMEQASSRLEPTYDPLYDTIVISAEHAYQVGYLTQAPDLNGLVDLSLLNQALTEAGLPSI